MRQVVTGSLVIFLTRLLPACGNDSESTSPGAAGSASDATGNAGNGSDANNRKPARADAGADADVPLANSTLTAVWANTGEDKVAREDTRATGDASGVVNSSWDGSKITVFGGRNEVVNFNLILEAGDGPVADVSVEFNQLEGPDGGVISSESVSADGVFDWSKRDIELFYVRYLTIKGLSYVGYDTYDERHVPTRFRRPWSGDGEAKANTTWADRPDADKGVPEIAVPYELVESFDIANKNSQAIWCDIYIPKDATPGLYTGQVSISEGGEPTHIVPVELEVRDLTLPDLPTIKTWTFLSESNVNRRHLGQTFPTNASEEAESLLLRNRFFQLFHRHKLTLTENSGTSDEQPGPNWTNRLDGSLFTAPNGYAGPGQGVGLDLFIFGNYGGWDWQDDNGELTEQSMQEHADAAVEYMENNLPDTEYFIYLIDESDDLEQTEQWAQWIESSPGPGARLMSLATMDIVRARTSCPTVDIPATVTNQRNSPDAWESAAAYYRDAPDKRLYFYNGKRPMVGSFATEDDGVALRATSWIQYKLGIDRWYFYMCNGWQNSDYDNSETNVFQTAATYGAGEEVDELKGETGNVYSNGNGVLVYPGTDQLFPEDSYGILGPIAGLRMKFWRRGVQDGDYLALARAINPTRVQEIIDEIVPKGIWEYGVGDPADPTWIVSDVSWKYDPDVWEAARAELATLIEQGQ